MLLQRLYRYQVTTMGASLVTKKFYKQWVASIYAIQPGIKKSDSLQQFISQDEFHAMQFNSSFDLKILFKKIVNQFEKLLFFAKRVHS